MPLVTPSLFWQETIPQDPKPGINYFYKEFQFLSMSVKTTVWTLGVASLLNDYVCVRMVTSTSQYLISPATYGQLVPPVCSLPRQAYHSQCSLLLHPLPTSSQPFHLPTLPAHLGPPAATLTLCSTAVTQMGC